MSRAVVYLLHVIVKLTVPIKELNPNCAIKSQEKRGGKPLGSMMGGKINKQESFN